jgi:hypothetical protein
MLSYQYFLHFPKLQKYSVIQDKSLVTQEKRKMGLCWAEAEDALRKQNKFLYYLDWSKQDQLFSTYLENKICMPRKKLKTVMPSKFMDMIDNFKFAMDEKEVNDIHKSSRLVLDLWNNFKKTKPKAYIIRDDLEELIISSASYSFAQLSDYLYSCNEVCNEKGEYNRNYRHGYNRSVDKTLAVSAMLLRFWFGQVSLFDDLKKYVKIDKLRKYAKNKSYIIGVDDFLEAFEVYLDDSEVDTLNKERIKKDKEEAVDRAKILFNDNYIKSLDDIESKNFIDYEFLQESDNFVVTQNGMEENILLDFIDDITGKLSDKEKQSTEEDSITLKTGYRDTEKVFKISIDSIDKKGIDSFEKDIIKQNNLGEGMTHATVSKEDVAKIVGSIRKTIGDLKEDTSAIHNSSLIVPKNSEDKELSKKLEVLEGYRLENFLYNEEVKNALQNFKQNLEVIIKEEDEIDECFDEKEKLQKLWNSGGEHTYINSTKELSKEEKEEKELLLALKSISTPEELKLENTKIDSELKAKWTPERIKESRDKFTNKDTDRYTGAIGEDSIEFPEKLKKNLEELNKNYKYCSPEYSEKLTEYNEPKIVGKVRRNERQEYFVRMEESKKQKEEFDKENDVKVVGKIRKNRAKDKEE